MWLGRVLVVFLFKIVEAVVRVITVAIVELVRLFFRSVARRSERSSTAGLSAEERVLRLEQARRREGYKPGWLYYRCEEEGLLPEYEFLRREGRLGV